MTEERAAPNGWRAITTTARPLQWAKNVLVFAAPGAGGQLDDWSNLGAATLAFVACCLTSSGLYFWNDVFDREADARHPRKRFRPIAAGTLSVSSAMVIGTIGVIGGIALVALTGHWQASATLAGYAVSTMAYSMWLKHVAVVDLVVIAAGFFLRAAIGAAATDVPMSKWFVLCTVFGSLFIAAGKRYAELHQVGPEAAAVRPTLGTYSLPYLRLVVTVALGATLLTYCQWALESDELVRGGSDSFINDPFYELSIVPMLTALLRYALVLESGEGAAPEEVFARDRVLQLLGVAWLVCLALGVYL